MNEFKILVDYKNFSDDMTFSQALKVSSNNYLDKIDYVVNGEKTLIASFEGYSKNILLNSNKKEELDSYEYNAFIIEKDYDELLNDIKNSDEDSFFFLKSFNKKVLIYLTKNGDLTTFNELNKEFNEPYFILSSDKERFNESINEDSLFKGNKDLEDILVDESSLIVIFKDTFFNYLTSIRSLSNYFAKRFEQNNKKSTFGKISNIFKGKPSESELNSREKNLYTDLILEANIIIKKEDKKYYLYLPHNLDVNDMIKSINLLSSLLLHHFLWLHKK